MWVCARCETANPPGHVACEVCDCAEPAEERLRDTRLKVERDSQAAMNLAAWRVVLSLLLVGSLLLCAGLYSSLKQERGVSSALRLQLAEAEEEGSATDKQLQLERTQSEAKAQVAERLAGNLRAEKERLSDALRKARSIEEYDAVVYHARLGLGDGLSGGKWEDTYVLSVPEGGVVEIGLESEAFDPYLRAESGGEVLTNDDGGYGNNAALSLTQTSGHGDWKVTVTSYRSGAFGTYRLRFIRVE